MTARGDGESGAPFRGLNGGPHAGGVQAISPGSRSAPRVMSQKRFLPWKGCSSSSDASAFRRLNV